MKSLLSNIFCLSVILNMSNIFCDEPKSKEEILKLWAAAVYDGDVDKVKSLIDKVDVKSKNKALIEAATYRNKDLVNYLLTVSDINVNTQDDDGLTPLMAAVISEDINIVKPFLKASGVDLNVQDNEGRTALIFGATNGKDDIVKVLIADPRIKLNIQDISGNSALIWSAYKGHEKVAKALLDVKADTELTDNQGKTARDYAKKPSVRALFKS